MATKRRKNITRDTAAALRTMERGCTNLNEFGHQSATITLINGRVVTSGNPAMCRVLKGLKAQILRQSDFNLNNVQQDLPPCPALDKTLSIGPARCHLTELLRKTTPQYSYKKISTRPPWWIGDWKSPNHGSYRKEMVFQQIRSCYSFYSNANEPSNVDQLEPVDEPSNDVLYSADNQLELDDAAVDEPSNLVPYSTNNQLGPVDDVVPGPSDDSNLIELQVADPAALPSSSSAIMQPWSASLSSDPPAPNAVPVVPSTGDNTADTGFVDRMLLRIPKKRKRVF